MENGFFPVSREKSSVSSVSKSTTNTNTNILRTPAVNRQQTHIIQHYIEEDKYDTWYMVQDANGFPKWLSNVYNVEYLID